jgi:sensor c-di-GMP phosphodiesterase-like protein
MLHFDQLRPQFPIICIIALFLVVYTTWVISLFRPRKDGCQRRWRSKDWVWVPLAAVTGVLLLVLWWNLRQHE